MILLIILVSFVLGASAFAWPDNRTRPRLLLVGAAIHLAGVISLWTCLLYTSPSPRDLSTSRMPSSA